MDTGDEAAQEAYRQMKEAADEFLRWLLGAAHGAIEGAGRLSSRTKEIKESIVESYDGEELAAAQSATAATAQEDVSCLTAYAADEHELDTLWRELRAAGIEHYFDANLVPVEHPRSIEDYEAIREADKPVPDKNGLYSVHIPDREFYSAISILFTDKEVPLTKSPAGLTLLKDADAALKQDLAGHFSLDAAVSRTASARACTMSALSAGDRGAAPRSTDKVIFGREGNQALLLETVRWDREGSIIGDNLDKLSIPFASRPESDSLMRFEFSPRNADVVKEVIDSLIANVSGFTEKRIQNYPDLVDAARCAASPERPEKLTSTIPASQAAFVTEYLREAGISYSAIADHAAGTQAITVDAADIAAHADVLESALASGLSDEQVREAMEHARDIAPGTVGKHSQTEGRTEPTEIQGYTRSRTLEAPTLDRDSREAQRALDAMELSQGAIEKTRSKAGR